MKPEIASQQHGDPRFGALAPAGIVRDAATASLNDEQQRVLACLKKENGGLTARQIQSRLGSSSSAVENALVVLVERQFIARLNTLVPSYVYRVDGFVANGG